MSAQQFSICVYCGSRDGARKSYLEVAEQMGTLIADEGWRMVYGAGDVGLMGAVARAAQKGKAKTFGVIPIHLLQREVGKTDLDSFVITENMHERKKVMYMNADVFVVLPGGAGSLDEFFEVLTWRQLGLHKKPIYILNIDGYWDKLIELVDHIIDNGFADSSMKAFFNPVGDIAELRQRLLIDSAGQ